MISDFWPLEDDKIYSKLPGFDHVTTARELTSQFAKGEQAQRLNGQPRAPQLVSGRARIRTQAWPSQPSLVVTEASMGIKGA